jgi:hypothetical protein
MAGPEPGFRSAAALVVAVALASSLGSCASSGKEPREPLPPRAVTTVPQDPAPPSEPPVATPAPRPTTVIVLDPGDVADEAAGETLAEAAARERARRRNASPPAIVINDKNLAQFAEGQTLTVAEPADDRVLDEAVAEALTADGKDESWWRARGLEVRQRWRDAVDAVARLEGEAAELRTRFYAADDPYLRDTQIKPEWDRALAELEKTRREAAAGPAEVEAFLEQGRVAGALPGWLREGVELEPVPVLQRIDEVEAIEPVAAEPPPE